MPTRFSAIQTILFDVDGTLLDTHELIFQAYESAAAQMGLARPEREWLRFQVGRQLEAVYADLDPDHVPELVALHRKFQLEHLELSTPYEGVAQVLARLQRSGFNLAVVTSRSNVTSVKTLELANIARYFQVVVSAEDAPALKPDPAPLLVALEQLKQPIETALMVGDAVHDINAARALGIRVIAATYGFPGAEILNYHPDAFIEDIRDLPALLI